MHPHQSSWIGIDWGGTHRRAWRYDAGELVARHDDAQGLLACAPRFAESLAALLDDLRAPASATVVMAGMIGSAQGWQEAPYLEAGRPLGELPQRLVRVTTADAPDNGWIVPGVRWRGRGDAVDVMRGEETQLLGALKLLGSTAAADADGWYVLPGTHSKWVWLQGGCVRWLRTYLTGELFALLHERGTLAPLMQAGTLEAQHDPQVFARGVAHAGEATLSHALFGARARVVTGSLPREATAAYVSGVLIGAEWQDLQRNPGLGGPVRVIGDARLAAHHAACAAQLGHTVEVLDVRAVQQAAWQALREEMPT